MEHMTSHASGLEDEGELAYVSAEFFSQYHDRLDPSYAKHAENMGNLLAFQRGWKACKDYYKINT